MSDLWKDPLEDFSGKMPIFPLPNVVFFPHTFLPLHIFEERYRAMVADAANGEKLICMALRLVHFELLQIEELPLDRLRDVEDVNNILAHPSLGHCLPFPTILSLN